MIWHPAKILKENTTTDALNNVLPAGTYAGLKDTQARISPWTVQDAQLLGREVTTTQMRILFPFPASEFPVSATHVKLCLRGEWTEAMEIVEKKDAGRFTSVYVRGYKTGWR